MVHVYVYKIKTNLFSMRSHDIGSTQVCQDNRIHIQYLKYNKTCYNYVHILEYSHLYIRDMENPRYNYLFIYVYSLEIEYVKKYYELDLQSCLLVCLKEQQGISISPSSRHLGIRSMVED